MNKQKKIALIACKGLNSQILLNKLLKSKEVDINLLIEVPIIPISPKTGRAMGGTINKIKRSPLKFLAFQLLVFHIAAFLASILGRSLNKIAKKNSIPVVQIKFVDQKLINLLKKNGINLIINSSAVILTDEILLTPTDGILNCHAAPLPKFRGPGNVFWMLAESIKNAYGTIHFVDSGIDSGPLVMQTVPHFIQKNTTLLSLWTDIRLDLSVCLLEIIKQYRNTGIISSTPQNEANSCYRSFPDKQSLSKLKIFGHNFCSLKDLGNYVKCILSNV